MILYKVIIKRVFLLAFLIFFVGCDSTPKDNKICPVCKMEVKTKKFSAKIGRTNFDDIGCMILWAKKQNIDFNKVDAKVYASDTNRYISAKDAFFTFNEHTPMRYGFNAYEHKLTNSIDFDTVRLRMLRGETMVNPKIRKKILGY